MKMAGAAALGVGMHTFGLQTLGVGAAQRTERRNIIFILVDDLRYDGIGVLNPFFKTPALDSLIRGGVLFENAFVTTSLCSPSRASILSGQYAHRHGVLDNNTPLPTSTPTFPAELQRIGYRTAYLGKWHMGGSNDSPRPGFDRWVSFPGVGAYYNPIFNVDGEHVKGEGYVTDLLTEYAANFIASAKDRPFVLCIGHTGVHADFEPAKRHANSYAEQKYPYPASIYNTEKNYQGKPAWVRAQRQSWHGVDGMYNHSMDLDICTRRYAETLRAVDESVGHLVDVLRENGLLDSTLILFTSDNGFQFGEHGLIDKRTMYEASIRVPLIAHCPSLFGGGGRRKEMVLNIDFAPTILDAAGAAIPGTVQGKSFYGLLQGSRSDWRDAWLYEYFWERSFPQTPTVLGIRTDRHKFMRYHGIWDCYELYDIQKDPDEMDNLLGKFMVQAEGGSLDQLIASQARGEVKDLFGEMSRRLQQLLKETGSDAEPHWGLVEKQMP